MFMYRLKWGSDNNCEKKRRAVSVLSVYNGMKIYGEVQV